VRLERLRVNPERSLCGCTELAEGLTLTLFFDNLLSNFLTFFTVGRCCFLLSRQECSSGGCKDMQKGLKKLVIWVVILACGYFILSNHFIFIGKDLRVLKKAHLTLEYTIFSTQGKSIESIMDVDELRKDGIGKLLVEAGKITEDQLEVILENYR
jgi:hypothetical protein